MERTQYGKYTVVEKIGQGAMGEVFKAHDPVLNRHVALKTIASSLESNSDARQRFHNEAQSIARLNHPNIVTVYDFGEEKGVVYMAMELLDGSDLRNLINNNTLANLDAKLAVMEQVCNGVGYAHAQSVVHRDLKPANIQVLKTGHVKVMDFGLARIGAASGMTATGAVLGTPHYMSPEQVKGQRADSRSDVFALGAILYQLLTGHQPFDAESVHAVLFKILEGDPEPVDRWTHDVPAEVAGLAVRALAKDPQARFQDGADMAEAVSTVRSSLPGGKLSSDPQTLATLLATEAQGETHLLPTASQGALALDALIDSGPTGKEKTLQGVPTLSGKAPTRPGPGRRSPAPAPTSPAPVGSRWVRAAVVAVGVILAVGLVAWGLFRPGQDTAPIASEPGGQSALEQQLLVAERTLAQQSLQDREYGEAVTHAERALAVVADDAESLRVRQAARQALDSAEAAAGAAREALEQGDNATAGRRLGELLEIQPEHPAVADLTSQLNDSFRPQAEEARAAAEAAEATRSAEAAAARTRAVEEEAARVRAAQEDAARARAAEEEAARARAQPPPAPAPPRATVATAPPPAPAAGPSDDELIRSLVADYERAIESQDLGLFRRVKPNLSGDEEGRLRQAFQAARQNVTIEILEVDVSGDTARVRLVRSDSINGDSLKPFQQLLSLRKGPGGWVVETIGR